MCETHMASDKIDTSVENVSDANFASREQEVKVV